MSNNPILSAEDRELEKAWESVEEAKRMFIQSVEQGFPKEEVRQSVRNLADALGVTHVPVWIGYAIGVQLDAIAVAMLGEPRHIQDKLSPMVKCLDELLEIAWCEIGGMPCQRS